MVPINGCVPKWHSLFPESFPVFQWHEETFNLPREATLLAHGDAVKNQAFRPGSAVGVQFHPEVTMEIVSAWVKDLPGAEEDLVIRMSERNMVENGKRCSMLIGAFTRGWAL